MTLFEYDKEQGVPLLCGVDEAGRGPLAGDVYAAAVILPPDIIIEGINDSKKLSPKKREELSGIIREKAVAWYVAAASVAEIEEYNILQATFLAMRRAVAGLSVQPGLILVDGNRNPRLSIHSRCVIKGDATSACIAAASILAKVERDRYMEELDRQYPQYQFAKHKGYGTKLHYQMLDEYGPSPVHRLSFLKKYYAVDSRPDTGRLGEDAAADYLLKKGYAILCRNYHSRYGEIDIIAKKGSLLSFVEVKTRKENTLAPARDAVTPAKQQKVLRTALCYLQENGMREQPRFDVIEVYFEQGSQNVRKVNWIENAFDGGTLDVYF